MHWFKAPLGRLAGPSALWELLTRSHGRMFSDILEQTKESERRGSVLTRAGGNWALWDVPETRRWSRVRCFCTAEHHCTSQHYRGHVCEWPVGEKKRRRRRRKNEIRGESLMGWDVRPAASGGDQRDDRLNQLSPLWLCPCASSLCLSLVSRRSPLLLFTLEFELNTLYLNYLVLWPHVACVLVCFFPLSFVHTFCVHECLWKRCIAMMQQCRKIKCHSEEIVRFFLFVFLIFSVYLCALLVTKLGIINPLVNEPRRFGHLL